MDGYITCFFVARCPAVHTDLWTVVDPAVPPVSHQPHAVTAVAKCFSQLRPILTRLYTPRAHPLLLTPPLTSTCTAHPHP